jgi:hypothetical protein
MATYSSTQYGNATAVPPALLKPNELGGRHRIAYFSVTTSAYASTGDIINLTIIPKGARIIAGALRWAANAASTTLTVGTAASAAKYLGSTAVGASAGSHAIAATLALNFGEELTADTVITATPGGATWTAGTVIAGHIEYVLD